MRNREDVDLMLDGVPHFKMTDEDIRCLLSPYGSWCKCGVCGEVVAKTTKGVCPDCRQLEGSVWTRGW